MNVNAEHFQYMELTKEYFLIPFVSALILLVVDLIWVPSGGILPPHPLPLE